MTQRIAFVVQLPKGVSPGQRFRFEAWEPALAEAGYRVDTFPFWSMQGRSVLYRKGFYLRKAASFFGGFLRRIGLLFKIRRYNWVFLQREAMPIGPPVFEWIIAKVLRVPIIYDFDDAIWLPTTTNPLARLVKSAWKVGRICAWSDKVVGGNDYLCAYARRHTAAHRVVRIPTVVNTDRQYKTIKEHTANGRVVIGWTGSHSTLIYLNQIAGALERLADEVEFTFLVIADQPPGISITNMKFLPWNKATEIEDLLRMDIGVMPLATDPWTEGKCGFKLIQYLALGIPAVASPVGVNCHIVQDGEAGFFADTDEAWVNALVKLVKNPVQRQQFGRAGREFIERHYSIAAHRAAFLQLFARRIAK